MGHRDRLHVLVVEEDAAEARRVREALEGRGAGAFRATVVRDLEEAEPRLPEADLVLLDLSSSAVGAPDALDRVRASGVRPPVVVLSADRDEEAASLCIHHGAQDVLYRDSMDADAFARALHCAVERNAMAEDRDAALLRARRGEESLRLVLSASSEGMVVCDGSGRTLFANPAAETLLGWVPGSGAGRPLNLPVETEGPVEMERRCTRGEIRTLELRTARVSWEGGPAVLATLHDLTLRRRSEEERRELEARRREAETLGALGRLAGGIAHGLNNQLTVILGFASLLLEEGVPGGSVAEHARRIREAGWCAAELMMQLTACAGRQPAIPERVDLNELVAGSRERIESAVREGIRVRWDLLGAALPIRADRRLIEQALGVMAEYARDSMPGGGDLTVSTGFLLPPRRHPGPRGPDGVYVAVSDTGPGLGAEARRRLFEPFYTTDVLGIGSGLGLAPVHGIAQQCGGRVEVSGGWSRGTTLRLILPSAEDHALPGAPGGPAAALPEGAGAEAPPRGDETVLVVEEDAPCREVLHSSLRDLGYRVLQAADAGDAVRAVMAWNGPIPLLVAGFRARGLRGPVLARVLRCRIPDLRAIFLASDSEVDDPELALPNGDHVLAKPFEVRDLAREVRNLLDRPPRSPTDRLPPVGEPGRPVASGGSME